jgi:hypothetical protein
VLSCKVKGASTHSLLSEVGNTPCLHIKGNKKKLIDIILSCCENINAPFIMHIFIVQAFKKIHEQYLIS